MATSTDEEILSQILNEINEKGTTKIEPTIPIQEVSEKVVLEGQVEYSTVFGKSFTGISHPVTVFKKKDWHKDLQMFIPKSNPNYVFQPEATEKMVVAIELGDKSMITGPTGSGKSTLIKEICARLNRPFIRINMTGDMDSGAFFGQYLIEDGATVWKNGPMAEGALHGAVVLIDEWELSPPEITMGLQWLLEDDGELYLKEKAGDSKDKIIQPHNQFRIVCGGNTLGQGDETGAHAGVNVQNTASIDRFQTVCKLDYLTKSHELNILKKAVPTLNADIADKMLQFASLLRQGYKQGSVSLTMSPRTLINWAKKTTYWGDPLVALKMAFFDKISENEKPEVNQIVTKVFTKPIK